MYSSNFIKKVFGNKKVQPKKQIITVTLDELKKLAGLSIIWPENSL